MTIQKMITKLQELQSAYGDIEIYYCGGEGDENTRFNPRIEYKEAKITDKHYGPISYDLPKRIVFY